MIRKKLLRIAFLIFFSCMTCCILCMPKQALSLSLEGLNLWFQKMIPALLPFMILSGLLIRLDLSDRFAAFFAPLLRPLFSLSDSCLYVIVIGFLCGFPMGARVCAQSYQKKKLSKQEATLLLAFCNNIGPVYLTGYVLALFPLSHSWIAFVGMYAIPLLYGCILRYTIFLPYIPIVKTDANRRKQPPNFFSIGTLFYQLNASILSALDAITLLGGYMIFCSLLNVLPQLFLSGLPEQLAGCLLEITSGLARLSPSAVFWAYVLLPFGGLSCLAQTYSCIRETDLSLRTYFIHKILQTVLAALFYWAVLPKVF